MPLGLSLSRRNRQNPKPNGKTLLREGENDLCERDTMTWKSIAERPVLPAVLVLFNHFAAAGTPCVRGDGKLALHARTRSWKSEQMIKRVLAVSPSAAAASPLATTSAAADPAGAPKHA
jgi:hypothetical protein